EAVVSSRSTARLNAVADRRTSEPVEQLRRHELRALDAAAVATIELHRRFENQVALHVGADADFSARDGRLPFGGFGGRGDLAETEMLNACGRVPAWSKRVAAFEGRGQRTERHRTPGRADRRHPLTA